MDRKPQFNPDGIRHATINNHRFHLRLTDPTEDNFLWVDGLPAPLVVDQTAAEMIGHIIDAMWLYQTGDGDESEAVRKYVVEQMHAVYGGKSRKVPISKDQISKDLDSLFGTLMKIAEGQCPVNIVDGEKVLDFAQWIAPARMDLAATYRCNLNCGKCYAGGSKDAFPEITLSQWIKIYSKLWDIGVPHVNFTGGEPTLRTDLIDLINEADEFVTGLITNGTMLAKLAERLRKASLDYAQVTIESFNPDTHNAMTQTKGSWQKTVDGIKAALQEGIQITTNTTLTKMNGAEFLNTIDFLGTLGIKYVACNTLICSGRGTYHKNSSGMKDYELRDILIDAKKAAEEKEMVLSWYSPTCYTLGIDPNELGFGPKTCSAAAYNMTVQPDGTVLPCQSWPDTVGNILTDPWEAIWNHPTCLNLRENSYKKDECKDCEHEEPCGGSCPLDEGERTRTPKTREKGGCL